MTKSHHESESAQPISLALRADFDASQKQREAIEADARYSYDLSAGYVLVSSVLPTLRTFEPQLEKALPEFDTKLLQTVEVYGRAALYAQGVDRSTTSNNGDAHAKLVEELESLYGRLYRNADFLSGEGLFSRAVLNNARTGTSVRDRAADLRTLAIEFAENESALSGRTLVTRDVIERAFAVAQAVLDSLAAREALTEAQLAAQRDRQRAGVLFYRAYNEIRRAISWLRWNEGDADKLAPSLHSLNARRSSRGDSSSDERDPDAPSKPEQPAPLPSDKRDELQRNGASNASATKSVVPQEDPFKR